ncbi:mannose-1-phosphate guanylyltransferase/mannose-6-phosphate isomerase [Tropicimonas sediminicola]|uniref:Mannose-1-phosphate guanylyltransferase/mannose-1-phosphate guanylyltransferase / mannose-6-phosphate isomerase n=1 Tax=Tropicimonas sediminicola TaxID=1031541 RepID=A0A239MK06_9RHOB|nr:mannose-1-phosphate guanylyltransferase/mannose-6-phosphate isomerase [Tropicimonas sediminicola]SNT43016.1 mannose-1-phosphate guanylyltransferase/mannose-1-phosphate guanylyltransferase / mannose-6-phosphate isomerase [Tropicimonas sediminicola]
MSHIVPLVLCGGTGSRLWPVSRTESPKQFHAVSGGNSLSFLQATVQRHTGERMRDPILVTNAKHAHYVRAQLDEIQMRGEIIGEPVARNTGPAVLAAALKALKADRDAVLLVLPADHVIEGDVNGQVSAMYDAAQDGRIITYGILPAYPETGYGYITDGGPIVGYDGLHHVGEFVEKPPLDRAQALLDGGRAYWASGISMFRAETIVEEYRRFDPGTFMAVFHAVANETRDTYGAILDPGAFSQAESQPTEIAVFEKTDAIALAPLSIGWNDVGSWEAMHSIGAADDAGNVLSGDVISIDTRNSLVRSQDRLVAVVGLDDVVVIDTNDALLVASRTKSQQVKQAVQTLHLEDRREAHSHVTHNFHWGESHRAFATDACDVTHLTVKPGSELTVDGSVGQLHLIGVCGEFTVKGAPEGDFELLPSLRITLPEGQSYTVRNDGTSKGELVLVSSTHLVELPVAKTSDELRDELRA